MSQNKKRIARLKVVLAAEFHGDMSAMAMAAAVNPSTISRYLSGAIAPSKKSLRALCAARGISLSWLEGAVGSDDRIQYEERPASSTPLSRLPLVFTPTTSVPNVSMARETAPILIHRDRYYLRMPTNTADLRVRQGDYAMLHIVPERVASACDINRYRLIRRGDLLAVDNVVDGDVKQKFMVFGIVIRFEIDEDGFLRF